LTKLPLTGSPQNHDVPRCGFFILRATKVISMFRSEIKTTIFEFFSRSVIGLEVSDKNIYKFIYMSSGTNTGWSMVLDQRQPV